MSEPAVGRTSRAGRRSLRVALAGGRGLLALPLVLAAVAFAAQLLATQSGLAEFFEQPLQLRYLIDPHEQMRPEDALAALAAGQLRHRVLNNRQRGPFWLLVEVPAASGEQGQPDVLFLGDRHLQTLTLWPLDAAGELGAPVQAERGQARPGSTLRPTASGFALRLDHLAVRPAQVLARVTALGSSTFTASAMTLDTFEDNERRTERAATLLAGAFTALALFSSVVAWHSRSRVFALFTLWLLVSAAVAAVMLGHDYLVLGTWPSEAVEVAAKQLLLAAYATINAALFIEVFRRPLALVRWLRPMRWLRDMAAASSVLALTLPPSLFLAVFYLFALCEIAMLGSALVLIIARTRTPHAGWYVVSWAVVVAAALFEMLHVVGVLPKVPGVSFENGALVGALMTGAALGEMLAHERRRRVTAQVRAEESARHFRQIYNAAPSGMLRLDAAGRLLRINRLGRKWLGVRPADAAVSAAALFGADKAQELLAAAARGEPYSAEIVRSRPDDPGAEAQTFELQAMRQGDGIEVVLSDVSDRVELARTLGSMAMRDALTNLMNRRGLEQMLQEMLVLVGQGRPVCLAHLDLDRFKLVNDVFGHASGDRVLQAVARQLQRAVPAGAAIARLGGDEFVTVLPDHEIAAGRAVAETLVDCVTGAPREAGLSRFDLGASIGVVEITAEMTAKDVLACADRACMQAKARAPGTVVGYAAADGSLESYHGDVRMADALRSKAIFPSLELYAQPLVPLGAQRAAALEVLLRVRGHDGRIQAPGRLLGAAERSGTMSAVDQHVLGQVLEYLVAHPEHVQSLDFFAVNLSGASLNDSRFVANAQAMLAEHRCAARRLCLEITESVALYDVQNTRRFIESMGEHGVRIALDDFGAGYTSFKYLKDLRAQFIKIDGAFVRDMLTQPAHRAITESIVELAHKLGMQTIAEWIEDAPTLQALQQIQADFAQGYLLAAPKPIHHWLTEPMPRAALWAPAAVVPRPARTP